ncbi:MAG: FecR family protein [Treponema sp.]|nr:FecR family protein [Treponema sp.]
MKKIILAIFCAAIAFNAFAQNGVIRELSGTVEIKAPGSTDFTPASMGSQISPNTVISTAFNSSALIAVGSTLLTVRPLTRLTLTEIQAAAGSETLNVNLQAGRVRVDVNPPAGTRATMQVSSPNATASVRGTSFEFDTRNIHVHSGSVSFTGNHGRVMRVNAGYRSRIERDGTAAHPLDTKAAELQPPPPPGTDSTAGNTGDSSSSPGTFFITIVYTGI